MRALRSLTFFLLVVASGLTSTATANAATTAGAAAGERIAASLDFACSVRPTGQVACWGSDLYGKLGNGSATVGRSLVPVAARGVDDAVGVAAGRDHACAARATGAVVCWGSGAGAQLGQPDEEALDVPVVVPGVSGAFEVGAGNQHSCALIDDGTVRCWGTGSLGALGDGSDQGSRTPVAVTGLTDAINLGSGFVHNCAVRAGGTVACWGLNDFGQLGDGTTTTRLAPVAVPGITDAVQVAAGNRRTCALHATGQVSCWGYGSDGLGNGSGSQNELQPQFVSGITDATTTTAGNNYSCASRIGGDASCWGANSQGQLGDASTSASPLPSPVSNLADATAVSAYRNFSCALRASAAVRCWGANFEGELGNDSQVASTVPVDVVFGAAPTNTAGPTVSGTPTRGETLTCASGQWSGTPPNLDFSWLRDGAVIVDDITPDHVVVSADFGASLTCRVTATNTEGSLAAGSAALPVPAPPTKPNGAEPTVTGTAAVGATLTCVASPWTGNPTLTYRWLSDGAPIAGSTTASYVIAATDGGHSLACQVTAATSAGSETETTPGVSVPVPPVIVVPGPTGPTRPMTPATTETKTEAPTTGNPPPPSAAVAGPEFTVSRSGAAGKASFKIRASLMGAQAKTTYRLKIKLGKRTLATVTGKTSATGTVSRKIALNAAGRRAIKRKKSLTVLMQFLPAGGPERTIINTLKLR